MEADRAAGAPGLLALAVGLVLSAFLRLVDVVCRGLFCVVDDEGLFRELGMVGDRMAEPRRLLPQ